MADLVLRTFQSLARAEQLQDDGILEADWEHVMPGTEHAYARMARVMSEHGINTNGRPPIWAWRGVLRLSDADSLFDRIHELSRGVAILTFWAPEDLVLLSDYSHWCDALTAAAGVPLSSWWPQRRNQTGHHPEQACLPYLRLDWVTDIKPLPTADWDSLDLATPL